MCFRDSRGSVGRLQFLYRVLIALEEDFVVSKGVFLIRVQFCKDFISSSTFINFQVGYWVVWFSFKCCRFQECFRKSSESLLYFFVDLFGQFYQNVLWFPREFLRLQWMFCKNLAPAFTKDCPSVSTRLSAIERRNESTEECFHNLSGNLTIILYHQ